MGDQASTWLPIGSDPGSAATRALVAIMVLALGALVGRVVWNFLRGGGISRAARRALGHREPAPWATGEWACGGCHTVNRASNRICERCRLPREAAEMRFAPVAAEADIIPASIPAGAGATVTLEHNVAAHKEGLNGHWRLRVNSVIVGSAARRDGAVALLRAVEGADAVLFDPRGAGFAPYPIAALITAFESPRLPIAEACPEKLR